MTCEQARELAAPAASGDVTAAESRALDLHNSGCPECRAEAEGFEDFLAQLNAMRDEDFPESAGTAVRARVLAEIPTQQRPGWLAAWPAFAAVLACSAVLVVLLRPVAPIAMPKAPAPPTVANVPESAPAAMAEVVRAVQPRRAVHPKPAEPVVVHMFTSDPDVVIYWIADSNRKSSETGAM
jgi:hypothetical protein